MNTSPLREVPVQGAPRLVTQVLPPGVGVCCGLEKRSLGSGFSEPHLLTTPHPNYFQYRRSKAAASGTPADLPGR